VKLIAATLAAFTLSASAVAFAQHARHGAHDVSVPWQKQKGGENGDAPTPEFTASAPLALNCELMANTYEERTKQANNGDRGCAAAPDTPPNQGGDHVKDTERTQGPSFSASRPPIWLDRHIRPPAATDDDDDGNDDAQPPQ